MLILLAVGLLRMENISYRPPRLSLDHHADFRQSLEKPVPRREGDVRLSVEYYHRATTAGEAIEQRDAARREKRPPPKVDNEYEDDVDNNLHLLPHQKLFETMKTQPATGLSDSDVQARLKEYGANLLTVQKELWLKAWFRYFFGGFGFLLWPAVILCILAWHPLGKPPDPINLGLGVSEEKRKTQDYCCSKTQFAADHYLRCHPPAGWFQCLPRASGSHLYTLISSPRHKS